MRTVADAGWAGGAKMAATRLAVQVPVARAALALLAGVLRTGQADPLAQQVEQALAGPDVVDLVLGAVDGGGHAHGSGRLPQIVPGPGGGSPRHHRQGVPAVGGAPADVVDGGGRAGA